MCVKFGEKIFSSYSGKWKRETGSNGWNKASGQFWVLDSAVHNEHSHVKILKYTDSDQVQVPVLGPTITESLLYVNLWSHLVKVSSILYFTKIFRTVLHIKNDFYPKVHTEKQNEVSVLLSKMTKSCALYFYVYDVHIFSSWRQFSLILKNQK